MPLKPSVILLDEPCSALDPFATLAIEELMRELSEDYSIIIVTHNMKTLKFVANKVIMLHEGNIIFDGNTDELFSSNDSFIKYFVTGRRN